MEKNSEEIVKKKKGPGVGGYIALALFLLIFSGVLQKIPALSVFDLQAMIGKFGIIKGAEGNFTGAGGVGASQGFMLCLSLLPIVMLSMGIVELVNYYGGQDAAAKLLNPLMKVLLGVPGSMAVSLVASLNFSDIGSNTTRAMFENGDITEEDRIKMIAFQFPSCALINNLLTLMGMCISVVSLSMSTYIIILLILKIICCAVMRLLLKTGWYYGKKKNAAAEA